jgi:riboflavin biosynthesis pyrimidine reductase
MLADGLVDALHIFMYPLTRGEGPRLFPDGFAQPKFALEACRPFEHGMVYLSYRP